MAGIAIVFLRKMPFLSRFGNITENGKQAVFWHGKCSRYLVYFRNEPTSSALCKRGVNFLGNRLSIELKTANFID